MVSAPNILVTLVWFECFFYTQLKNLYLTKGLKIRQDSINTTIIIPVALGRLVLLVDRFDYI